MVCLRPVGLRPFSAAPSSFSLGGDDGCGEDGDGFDGADVEASQAPAILKEDHSDKLQPMPMPSSSSSSSFPGWCHAPRVLLRLFLVCVCATTAICASNLEKLLGVIGASAGSLLVLVFPAVISLRFRPPPPPAAGKWSPNRWASLASRALDVSCVVLGLLGATLGSWRVATFSAADVDASSDGGA